MSRSLGGGEGPAEGGGAGCHCDWVMDREQAREMGQPERAGQRWGKRWRDGLGERRGEAGEAGGAVAQLTW